MGCKACLRICWSEFKFIYVLNHHFWFGSSHVGNLYNKTKVMRKCRLSMFKFIEFMLTKQQLHDIITIFISLVYRDIKILSQLSPFSFTCVILAFILFYFYRWSKETVLWKLQVQICRSVTLWAILNFNDR